MNEFIDECLEEWRRLGVPDAVAKEMATDLAVDIGEAESEGGSAEDVLGNSAFDPRGFAASWALARGVTGPLDFERPNRHQPVAIALTALAALFAFAAVVVLVGHRSSSTAIAIGVRRTLGGSPSGQFLGPSHPLPPLRFYVPGPGFVVHQMRSVELLALIVLVIGAVGLVLAFMYWSPWIRRRFKRGVG